MQINRYVFIMIVLLPMIVKSAGVTRSNEDALLLYAVISSDLPRVRTALQLGADVNTADDNGNTVLMRAVMKGAKDMTSLLLANGADPFLKNKDGKSAIDIAKNRKEKDIVALLRQAAEKKETAKKR